MKAAVHDRYGPPDVVRIADIEVPTPRASDVLVKVHASTVNRTDCGFRAGKPFVVRFFGGLPRPRIPVWGCEFAGEVEAVGAEVDGFSVGDRVFGYSESTFGGHAEYVATPANKMLATIPPDMTFSEAAPALEGSHYALSALNGAKVRAGQHVLVYGATGGIGSAAVQLLKAMDVYVTAVCSTPHVSLVRGLGPDKVVDYLTEDFTADDISYDVVLDAVGKSTFAACRPLLKPQGTYLSSELGPKGQNPMLALTTPLLRRKKVLFPIPRQDPAMATYIQGLMATGQFRPVIDRRYPLDEIVDAYSYVESGRKVGNVVITVSSSAHSGSA